MPPIACFAIVANYAETRPSHTDHWERLRVGVDELRGRQQHGNCYMEVRRHRKPEGGHRISIVFPDGEPGPEVEVYGSDDLVNIVSEETQAHVMVYLEALPVLIEALTDIQAETESR